MLTLEKDFIGGVFTPFSEPSGKEPGPFVTVNMHDCLTQERYFLVYWQKDRTVSIHSEQEVKITNSSTIGDSVPVCRGKKIFEGQIAGIGKSIC